MIVMIVVLGCEILDLTEIVGEGVEENDVHDEAGCDDHVVTCHENDDCGHVETCCHRVTCTDHWWTWEGRAGQVVTRSSRSWAPDEDSHQDHCWEEWGAPGTRRN